MSDPVLLPDVNVLFAAHVESHAHHAQARRWLESAERFATCGITETGLVRLLSNPAAGVGVSPAQAIAALNRVRRSAAHVFWPDVASLADTRIDVSKATGYRQVTDFHLLALAERHGGALATLDAKIERSLAPADRRYVRTIG